MLEVKRDYADWLVAYFARLGIEGRGDSARGRNMYALHLLDFIWSQPRLPLHHYRPTRNPAAFLAMIFDLVGDHLQGDGDGAALGSSGRLLVQDTIRWRLGTRWDCFIDELASAGLPHLAAVLDETMKAVLRLRSRSSLPAYLQRLKLYMTPSQLTQVKVDALIDRLSVLEVLSHLDFEGAETGHEQHPVGGDLRKSIRRAFDDGWRRTLEGQGKHNLITLFACLPLDGLRLLASQGVREASEFDFAVFYALITDAKAPGRMWQPPAAYVGADEDWQHFAFLAARQDATSRKTQGRARLGISSTFPNTIRALDGWLESAVDFPELHTRRAWHRTVTEARDEIAQARARFLYALTKELVDHHD